MGTQMWPGASLSSARVHLYQSSRCPFADDDSDLSDNNSESSDLRNTEEKNIVPATYLRTSNKPKKRVTFQTDENLVEIFEIPARGEELEAAFEESSYLFPRENVPSVTPLEPDFLVSGQATGFSPTLTPDKQEPEGKAEKLNRSERSDRPVLPRSNTDVWGTYTVTHAISPVSTSSSEPKQSKVSVTQNKPKVATSAPSGNPQCPPSPSHPQRPHAKTRVTPRAKSLVRPKKKVSKTSKEGKYSFSAKNGERSDDEKVIATFLEKNAKQDESNDLESQATKLLKPKTVRGKNYRRSISSARNREKEIINKEMKGEGQKRIHKTYNNISSLHRNGARTIYRRPCQTNASVNRNSMDKPKANGSNKQLDYGKINTSSKVKLQYGQVKHSQSVASKKADAKKTANEETINDTQDLKQCVSNDVLTENKTEKPCTKSNGFIFPEESKFRFPLMTQSKETTSQLVRLDTDMLALYKKKLYAWHMANGTTIEGRIETPCISPLWEPLKAPYA